MGVLLDLIPVLVPLVEKNLSEEYAMLSQETPFHEEKIKPRSTYSLVKQIKAEQQDFEWYPTTIDMLDVVKKDLQVMIDDYEIEENPSILDCGAGDGRSLMYLTNGKRYAIEKSQPLVTAMDDSIFIIGADFHQQTFMDKEVNVLFCNPPYSEYSEWVEKIIRETKAGILYFVIPKRWQANRQIEQAIKLRSAEAEVLGQFDFSDADREARAVVDIVKVTLLFGDN